jgi:hypothetical protein
MQSRPILVDDLRAPMEQPGAILVDTFPQRSLERRIVEAAAAVGCYVAPVFYSLAPEASDVGTTRTTFSLIPDPQQGPVFVTRIRVSTRLAYAQAEVRNSDRRLTDGVVRMLDAFHAVDDDEEGMTSPIVVLPGDALSVSLVSSSVANIAATDRLTVRGLVLRDSNGSRVVDQRADDVAALFLREGEWAAMAVEAGGGTNLTLSRVAAGAATIVEHAVLTIEVLGTEGAVIASTLNANIGGHNLTPVGLTPTDGARTVAIAHDLREPVQRSEVLEVSGTWAGATREPVRVCLVGRRATAAGIEV